MTRITSLITIVTALALPATAATQTVGTFRWQLQPYCNVITVTITQVAAAYRLDGTDDQCGGGRDQAAVQGMAFANPDGTIGFGFTVVTAPGGSPVHVDADMSTTTFSGAWRDSAGGAGTFAFTPGAGTSGSPRPQPSAAVPAVIQLRTDGGLMAGGAIGQGTIPTEGPGTRMMWHPRKGAFRAGSVEGGHWNDVAVGLYSAAFGLNTVASGIRSVAFGELSLASGANSMALGGLSTASGAFSVAAGYSTRAEGLASTTFGQQTTASGNSAAAFGASSTATGGAAMAMGIASQAGGESSFAGGHSSSASGNEAFAFGLSAAAGGTGSVALGGNARTTANAVGSLVFADRSTTAAFTSSAPNEVGVRAAGGVYLYTKSDLSTGAALAANGSSWAALSDVNAKENFREVDGEALLAKLAGIPIREWNYKAQDAAVRHMGPTAQDFRGAFGLGDFPLRINTIDADGVALAGVKALEARTAALRDENAALRHELERLRAQLVEVLQARPQRR